MTPNPTLKTVYYIFVFIMRTYIVIANQFLIKPTQSCHKTANNTTINPLILIPWQDGENFQPCKAVQYGWSDIPP